MENEVEKTESNVIFKDDFERLETGDKWEFCRFSHCIKMRDTAVEADSA